MQKETLRSALEIRKKKTLEKQVANDINLFCICRYLLCSLVMNTDSNLTCIAVILSRE